MWYKKIINDGFLSRKFFWIINICGFFWSGAHGGVIYFLYGNYLEAGGRFAPYIFMMLMFVMVWVWYKKMNNAVKFGFAVSSVLNLFFDIIVIIPVYYIPFSSTDSIAIIYLPYYQFASIMVGFIISIIFAKVFGVKS